MTLATQSSKSSFQPRNVCRIEFPYSVHGQLKYADGVIPQQLRRNGIVKAQRIELLARPRRVLEWEPGSPHHLVAAGVVFRKPTLFDKPDKICDPMLGRGRV